VGIGRYVTRDLAQELDVRSKEFYEFVMPAIDIAEEDNNLVVTIDLPGFAKKDTKFLNLQAFQ
jgi:HSP20 family protein